MASDAVPEARGRRVLVVDDDPAIRVMVRKVLERQGFTVETANDGIEALEKLEQAVYDVLVLDLMMPRLDGFGVLDRLEGSAGSTDRPTPKILVMTAAAPSLLQKLPPGRVAAVLAKPFDIAKLLENAELLSAAARDESKT